MKIKHFTYFLGILICFTACEKSILKNPATVDPIGNFDLFWTNIDQHSGIILPKKINWDSVKTVYRPQVTSEITNDELWTIFSNMIEAFDDEHTVIFRTVNGEGQAYASGAHRIDDAINSFSKTVIQDQYLGDFEIFDPETVAPDFSFGSFKNRDIGYIYIGDTDGGDPHIIMDGVLAEIGNHAAIIFDVRNNGGGQGEFAQGVTDAFAQETRLVFTTQTRNGVQYDDYDEITEFYNTSDGENQYLKPIVLLTDAFTVSGAENITAYLKVNTNVTHVGDTTAGAFSALSNRRFLPNGWTYRYPMQMSLSPTGESFDGDGIAPDIYSKNTPENIAAGKDVVIEDALQYLFDQYGI
ncbi:MAG: S41 family peptidase [Saprospiraceae bacterium]